jgi:glycosyltransferase involved in cell wall biosynthesis
MKNVLIITYYFPPMEGIGGIRPFGIAKYLPAYGWNPIILTPILPGDPDLKCKIIQTPYKDVVENWKRRIGLNPKKSLNEQFQVKRRKNQPSIIDRCIVLPHEIMIYPDDRIGWYNFAVLAGEKILKTEQIDAILSSSRPETCHLVAKTLSEKYHVPWIADFRDLWSQNQYTYFSYFFMKYFEKKLEIKTLRHASVLTTVSQPLVNKLAVLHKSKKIVLIKNGFDPDLVNPGNPVDQHFTIIYTGYLYQGKRDPSNLFAVIQDLCEKEIIKRNDIKIDFFCLGSPENWLQEEIVRYHLQDIVTLHGGVSHTTAIAEQRKAHLLLLLTWNNPEEQGVYTGKLFEYLAARRPILSLGYTEGGVIKELLAETQAGVHVRNNEEIREVIIKAYREYKDFGEVLYRGIDQEVMKYSHQEMARKFGEVLDTVSQERL